jgi:hypothetical protein
MVYLWRIPEHVPEALIARYRRVDSPDRFVFAQGKTLQLESVTVHFESEGTAKDLDALDCLPNDAQLPVAGPRALDVFNALAAGDFQGVRTIVHTREGLENSSFKLLNITNAVTAIDHNASVTKLIPGTSEIRGFRKLVYNPTSLGSHALARDAEYPPHILVSERLVEALRTINATGIDLKRAESIAW